MDQNKIFKILGFSGETEAAVKAAISKKGIKSAARSAYEGEMPNFPICRKFPLNRLAAVVLLLCKKYDDYAAIGVPENIIAETFRDVSLRANLYRRKTGKVGISKEDALWFRHIMNTAIFKIGVLQFQPFEMIYLDEELFGEPYMIFSPEQKRKLPTGAQVINRSVRHCSDLSTEKCSKSFWLSIRKISIRRCSSERINPFLPSAVFMMEFSFYFGRSFRFCLRGKIFIIMYKRKPANAGFPLSIRIAQSFFNIKKIVSRNFKKTAKRTNIFNARRIFSTLNIRYFPLCHINSFTKFRLVHVHIFSECSDFFTKS